MLSSPFKLQLCLCCGRESHLLHLLLDREASFDAPSTWLQGAEGGLGFQDKPVIFDKHRHQHHESVQTAKGNYPKPIVALENLGWKLVQSVLFLLFSLCK